MFERCGRGEVPVHEDRGLSGFKQLSRHNSDAVMTRACECSIGAHGASAWPKTRAVVEQVGIGIVSWGHEENFGNVSAFRADAQRGQPTLRVNQRCWF